MKNQQSKNPGIIIGILVVCAVGLVTFFAERKTSTSAPASVSADSLTYKDGTYSATGSYMSPAGEHNVAVTLTLANGIVTDVTAVPSADDRTSQEYQAKFLSGYKQYVVGQNIADLHLTKVSGSSLTPIGFDAALAEIKTQAQA